MKSLLCAIVKNENKYLSEWVQYYRELGFDGILIYDNNDIDGETIDLQYDYISIIDYRGKHISRNDDSFTMDDQEIVYNDCYFNHSSGYDWVAFFDVDEFLTIDNNLKINEFLSQDKFSNTDAIQINWEVYGDSGNIRYDERPVIERFTTPIKSNDIFVKSIIRTGNPNLLVVRAHSPEITNGIFSYPDGSTTKQGSVQKVNYSGARIRHYYTKTIEEWIDRRCAKTSCDGRDRNNTPSARIREFFIRNEITEEKMNVVKEKLGDITF